MDAPLSSSTSSSPATSPPVPQPPPSPGVARTTVVEIDVTPSPAGSEADDATGGPRGAVAGLARWLDSGGPRPEPETPDPDDHRIEWLRVVPFIGLHLACLAVIWVGFSWTALAVCAGLYVFRMFAITGFYHRYFSHRTFRTSRAFQFLMGVAGASAVQRGPMWWAAHHRHHHKHSDDPHDLHSPEQQGFWRAHMGWFMTKAGFRTNERLVRDWMRYPELTLLDRFDWLVPTLLAGSLVGLGALLQAVAPGLGTGPWQLLVWGFVVSTVLCYHATYTIKSLAHTWGRRRFATDDDSRNNFLLALITLGEGWHNNHHHYPASVRQGFYWWEIDVTWYVLRGLAWLGLIWDLKGVPARALERGRAAG